MRKGVSEDPGSPGSSPPRGTESLVSEVFRRVLESGKGLSAETVRQLLADMRLPRETLLQLVAQHTLSSVEELKHSVYRSISKELQAVLEKTNLAEEIATALSKLSLEVRMEVQFKPRRDGEPSVQVKRRDRSPQKNSSIPPLDPDPSSEPEA